MADKQGTTVKDVSSHAFVKMYAEHLKRQGKIELPSWVDLVKTATHKELCPFDQDWYYIRAASIARHVYLRPHTGIGGLQKKYGSRARRGTLTEHFHKANSGLIRHILKQLEAIGVVEKDGKGRIITSTGQQDLDRIAGNLKEKEEEEDEEEGEEGSEEEEDEEAEEAGAGPQIVIQPPVITEESEKVSEADERALDLRKGYEAESAIGEPKQLYKVLEQKSTSIGPGIHGSAHQYVISENADEEKDMSSLLAKKPDEDKTKQEKEVKAKKNSYDNFKF
mmetsp:Transcript_20860/g.26597  ORF Transcript_20860/g.26597 Transcript_20860/m.26597 type:complete len:279 (+) Transcript_20860:158-994(+)